MLGTTVRDLRILGSSSECPTPGALSAWFRLKFPHLTCGSLASSGVVLAVYNYTDFDKQVGGTM
jgi:hypothetical protein